MRFTHAAIVIFALWAPLDNAYSDVPKLMNYQGQIASRSGSDLTNPLNITFGIYAQPETGAPLWQETQVITHENGVFQTLLGSHSPFPDALFSSGERYLEIRLQNEEPFLPRQRIVSVAFALEAARAENATGHLTPQSMAIGTASIDSSGTFVTPLVRTDSLVVGNQGVINRQGNWTGPPFLTTSPSFALDTIIVRNVQESLSFGSQSWLDVDGSSDVLTAFISLKKTSFLDAQFHTTISTTGSLFEMRLVVEPITPRGNFLENIGNISRFAPSSSSDLGSVSNQAVIQLNAGLYRVFVQGRTEGLGTLQTGIMTIRAYAK